MNGLDLLAGGIGCDLVTGTAEFTARLGKIGAIVSNADGTRISSMKFKNSSGTEVEKTTGTYLGAVDINNDKFVKPDYPLTKMTLSAGSAWVFYVNN
jgi:hypothetical protein